METTIIPIDLGFVNAYLVRTGEGFVLVDTGLSSQWTKLVAALGRSGCPRGRLSLVILTHADMDHAGNARRLQTEWKAPIAVHGEDARALETGASPKRSGRGPVAKALMGLSGLFRRAGGAAPTFKPDILLEDGARLEAWGLRARILHLPGHTRGSIAVLTDGGDLIAGDVFANRRRPDLSPFVENIDSYHESLGRAKALAGSITTVYPGHGASFSGAAIAGIEP
ncbi:MAG: MBL fold metallo-hydrolase [Rectinemataceae bacterium]|jgi:glyoxylase-like metal-dependent hydrolase (beta-lactamase superfamily II)